MHNIYPQSTQTLLTRVPQSTDSEFKDAIDAASQAYKSWSRTSVVTRQRFVLEYVIHIFM
jgi:malonate-semialdehyde dehydrogenase (acetylating) / methylmalonate-semialdehyde dehydrogenase